MFVAFGGVLFGYDTGTISGILAMEYVISYPEPAPLCTGVLTDF
jgi:hypothetical protein